MPSNSPTRYLSDRANHQTITLAGRHINIAKLAEGEDLDHSYCTRIINGTRTPSVDYLRKVAAGLGMSIDGLLEAIADLKAERLEVLRRRVS